MIESIEVIRGPAAARYGNGAAGGVVNIITKKFDDQWHFKLIEGQPVANPGAKGFRCRLFYRKTLCQKTHRLLVRLPDGPLVIAKHATGKAIAASGDHCFDTRNLNDIRA
jgi:outer membrane receptor for Fe3+-dicitrate